MTLLRMFILAGSLLNFSALPAFAENLMDNISFSAIAKSEASVGLTKSELQKWDISIRPEITMDISDDLRLTAIGLGRLETRDALEPGRPGQSMRSSLSRRGYIGDRIDVELREFYLDTSFGDTYLRLGKQQIVWGQADGLRVLDVVNPFNFREFILDDFEDRRIPLWALNLEIPISDITAQLIWLPDQTYQQIPEPGALYAITSPRFVPALPQNIPVSFSPAQKPGNFFADSDVGLRLSTFMGGWDLTLNYLYHYQDNAVLFQNKGPDNIILSPEYKRSHLIGGTFSNAFGSFTLRGEIGYATGRYFLSNDPASRFGVQNTDEISYVLGLDYTGIKDMFISAQLFQSLVTDDDPGMVRDRLDSQSTLLIERNFMNDSLKASVLLIHSLNDGDGLAQLGVEYDLYDNMSVKISADIFYGHRHGLFGQFSANDRLSISFEIGI